MDEIIELGLWLFGFGAIASFGALFGIAVIDFFKKVMKGSRFR